ncbi:Flavin-binding monooxygenase-like protein [Aspergillus sclerotialis]|uniref:Flavin-binding monooxygenase-like protein n=1 Tax=Aspergillus sclerotialis TaxID=2070753 RepID=A0A3A3A2G9_9EURO|nr:Flavin-binding monooxygenase-like protein [Aspergillus sclerotialis]
MNQVEVLIVGAGLHGLVMGKTYLEVCPGANLLVVDQASSIGGTWAEERIYPGLKTNNLVGSYELSDFPMDPEQHGLKVGEHIPGHTVHQYLHEFAEHFGLYEHILLRTKVVSATLLQDGSWQVTLNSLPISESAQPSVHNVFAEKIVLATGLTSEAYLPTFQGQDEFQGTILHSRQLAARAADLSASQNTVIIGGNKSAWDASYLAARSGAHVDMVIRPSGGGPSFAWPAYFKLWGFKTSLSRLASTRIFTCFDPSPLGYTGPFSLFRRFLHRTSLGRKILFRFWRSMDACIKKLNGYDEYPELEKLKPFITPFWMGNSLSILNYESNWFDLVRDGKIDVHIANVASLSKTKVRLSDGTILNADTLVYCTGWKAGPSAKLTPEGVMATTSFPTQPSGADSSLQVDVVESIYNMVPYLRTLPRRESNAPRVAECQCSTRKTNTKRPFRLYRLTVPSDRQYLSAKNLAFLGAHASIYTVMMAQVQALWATAFFLGKLEHLNAPNLDIESIEYNAIFDSVYEKIRRPKETGGLGDKYPDLVFDSLAYIDVLLRDLGLKVKRKKSFFKEMFEPYQLSDYRGLVQEWKRTRACTELKR